MTYCPYRLQYISRLTKHMAASKKNYSLRVLKVTSLNDLEFIRNIKRELIRKRKEIEAMRNAEEKRNALKAYAELLTSLEISTLATS